MDYSCCISKCHNTWKNTSLRDKTISFHRFPKQRSNLSIICHTKKELIIKQRNAWIPAINRKDILENELHNFRVCSVHFVNGSPAVYLDTGNTAWLTLKLDGENNSNTEDVEIENSNSSPVKLHIGSTILVVSEQTNKYKCWIEEKNVLKLKLKEMENAVKERDLMLKENEKNLNRSYTKLNKIESNYKEMETKFKNSFNTKYSTI